MIISETKGKRGGLHIQIACDECGLLAKRVGTHAYRVRTKEKHWCQRCLARLFPFKRTAEHNHKTSVATRAAMATPENKAYLAQNQPDRTGVNNSFYGKKHSESALKKISEKNLYSGQCNPWWHPWMLEQRKTWGDKIRKRFEHRCADCRKTYVECRELKIKLDAHHIAPVHANPELRYDLNNGVALCRPCHIKAHEILKTTQSQYQLHIETLLLNRRDL